MNKKSLITGLIILILLIFNLMNISSQTIKKDSGYSNDELIKLLTKKFPEETQLSIALVKDTLVDYLGVKKQLDSLIYVNNKDSIFEIGSITKIFTSLLLADFVYNHKVELDGSIEDILPFKCIDIQLMTINHDTNNI